MRMNKFVAVLQLACFLVLFLAAGYFIYLGLKAVFSQSALLGLALVFFGLPVLGRLFFLLFFGALSSLLGLLFVGSASGRVQGGQAEEDDDVIDVSCKVDK